jgi:hypothetical protein
MKGFDEPPVSRIALGVMAVAGDPIRNSSGCRLRRPKERLGRGGGTCLSGWVSQRRSAARAIGSSALVRRNICLAISRAVEYVYVYGGIQPITLSGVGRKQLVASSKARLAISGQTVTESRRMIERSRAAIQRSLAGRAPQTWWDLVHSDYWKSGARRLPPNQAYRAMSRAFEAE